MSTAPARSSFFRGVKAELPILLGVVPFGLIYGILAREAGLSVLQAQAMSMIVFAGSAQFVMAQLFALSTPASVIVVTAVLVNLRHALYSASVAPYVKYLSGRWRFSLAYLLTDEAYAVSINNYRAKDQLAHKHWFFLGAGLALWSTWQISTVTGILLGASIPAAWPLAFFLPLTFIALVVPALADWAALIAALTAGFVSILAFNLPYKLSLVFAALVGVAVGLIIEEAFYHNPSADSDQTPVNTDQEVNGADPRSQIPDPPATADPESPIPDRQSEDL